VGSTAKNISIGWLIAAIACSSLAVFFATGLHPRWWLMWFMPIPVLLVAARSAGPRVFFVALAAWFLGSLNMWGVLRNVLQVPLVPVLAMTSVHSTFGNLAYSQMNFLPILQLAALTGIWGISFCLS